MLRSLIIYLSKASWAQKIVTSWGFVWKVASRFIAGSDIADAIKKGKSSIYYYFKNKEEIFQSVVLQEAKVFRRTIIDAVNKEKDPTDKLKA